MGKPVSPAERDAQALLKEVMPVAKAGLEEREGFVPLAAVMENDGTVRRVDHGGLGETGAGAAQQVVALFREMLRQQAAAGSTRAVALAADVRIRRKEDGEEASNAVSVHVEHQSGYCVDLLIPYKVRKGMMSRLRKKRQVMFRAMIAQESERVIFSRAEATDVSRPTEQNAW